MILSGFRGFWFYFGWKELDVVLSKLGILRSFVLNIEDRDEI